MNTIEKIWGKEAAEEFDKGAGSEYVNEHNKFSDYRAHPMVQDTIYGSIRL
jgi:hypothetical protein